MVQGFSQLNFTKLTRLLLQGKELWKIQFSPPKFVKFVKNLSREEENAYGRTNYKLVELYSLTIMPFISLWCSLPTLLLLARMGNQLVLPVIFFSNNLFVQYLPLTIIMRRN